jgi:hypothetical protein
MQKEEAAAKARADGPLDAKAEGSADDGVCGVTALFELNESFGAAARVVGGDDSVALGSEASG